MFDIAFEKPGDDFPDVSICVPIWNAGPLLAPSLQSLFAQTGCSVEILISDDCSSDDSLANAVSLSRSYHGPHAIRVFRAPRRLMTEHRPFLSELASASFLLNAAQDDLSAPNRAARFLYLHDEHGAWMVSGPSLTFTDEGKFPEPHYSPARRGWLPVSSLLRDVQDATVMGVKYGLRKELYTLFPRLDKRYAPVQSDAVVPFRAEILGGVWYDHEILLERRIHQKQWSNALNDRRLPEITAHSRSLYGLACVQVMRKDLTHALHTGLIGQDRFDALSTILDQATARRLDCLLEARTALFSQNLEPIWVDTADIAIANHYQGPVSVSPAPNRRQSFDAEERWGLEDSTKVLPGSAPIEGIEGQRFAWLGPQSSITLLRGKSDTLEIKGDIPVSCHADATSSAAVALSLRLADGRTIGTITRHDDQPFCISLPLPPAKAGDDPLITLHLDCSSAFAASPDDPSMPLRALRLRKLRLFQAQS